MSAKPHDRLFRGTFSNPEYARAELAYVLPPPLSAHVDWATLEPQPTTFIDEALRETFSDLLFTVRFEGEPALVYLLFEHQSTVDTMMAFRELQYEVRIWTDWLRENPAAKKLPLILPILLSQGPSPWPAPTRFEELLDVPPHLFPLVAAHVPKFTLFLDDLALEQDAALRARPLPPIARLALWSLRNARNLDELLATLPAWRDAFAAAFATPTSAAAARTILRYLAEVHGPQEVLFTSLQSALPREHQTEMITAAEELRQEGMLKGLEKGLQQGQRKTLLRQLSHRFGPLPSEVTARVEQATAEDLERWTDRVLTEPTLAGVLE